MIKVIKHGTRYTEEKKLSEIHTYKCGYFRSLNECIGGCGCTFTATLNDFTHKIVGHGQTDYVAYCPECSRTIYDSINRVD